MQQPKIELDQPFDFEAHLSEKNIHRFYRIWMMRDMFSNLLVCVQYGRVGTYGRVRNYPVRNEQEDKSFIEKMLKKRAGAEKRIGVGYHCLT